MQKSQTIHHLSDKESIFNRKSQSILVNTYNSMRKKGGGAFSYEELKNWKFPVCMTFATFSYIKNLSA